MGDDKGSTTLAEWQLYVAIVAVFVAIVAIIVAIVIGLLSPEIRNWLGLGRQQVGSGPTITAAISPTTPSPSSTVITSEDSPVTPTSTSTPHPTYTPTYKYKAVVNGCNGGYGTNNYQNKFSVEGAVYEASIPSPNVRLSGISIIASRQPDTPYRNTQTGLDTQIYSIDFFTQSGTWYVWVDDSGRRVSEIAQINVGIDCPHAIVDFQLY